MLTRQVKSATLPLKAERRRSPRVGAVRSVEVAWHTEDGKYLKEHAETEVVSAHGGLLWMEHQLSLRQVVQLTLDRQANWTLARVKRIGDPTPGGRVPVAVELAGPSETFWGVLSWSGV